MIVAKSIRKNPMYTHIILGKEEQHREEEAYFTRAGVCSPEGTWGEYSGHYMMDIIEATKDFTQRLQRGY